MIRSPSTPRGLLLLLCLLLAGCKLPSEETRAAGKHFEVERLFHHDGCTAYRFYDGRWIYYVRCGDRVSTQSSYYQSTGKSGYTVDVHTSTEER